MQYTKKMQCPAGNFETCLLRSDCRASSQAPTLGGGFVKDLDGGVIHYVESGSVVDNPVHTRLDLGKRNHVFLAESLCCRLFFPGSA